MDKKAIEMHIADINAELDTNPDMQFKVELLKAKSMAMLAQVQNRESIKVYVGNADSKRFYLGGTGG